MISMAAGGMAMLGSRGWETVMSGVLGMLEDYICTGFM